MRALHQPQPTMRRRWGAGETSLRPIAPPATEEPNGRRARSSTATTPPPPCRTGDLGPRRHQARAGAAGGRRAANEFFLFTCNALTINYLEDVGTFDDTDPLEIRDNAAASLAFGRNGFNVPSLLSINYHAPYLHRGQAQTLEEVFPLHGGTRGRGFRRPPRLRRN